MNKKFVLNLNKIPELENANDAYYIDRNHNVGVLKYIGERPHDFGSGGCYVGDGHYYPRTYAVLGKNEIIETTVYCYGRCATINDSGSNSGEHKNEGCFYFLDGNISSCEDYIFVPNKEFLIDIFRKTRERGFFESKEKLYVLVPDSLYAFETVDYCRKTKETYEEKHNGKVYNDKDTFIAEFEKAKEKYIECVDEYIKKYNDLLSHRTIMARNHMKDVDYRAIVSTLKVGDKFVESPNDKERVFTIKRIDEYGVAHLEKGGVLPPYKKVFPFGKIEAAKIEMSYAKLRYNLKEIKTQIERLGKNKEMARKATPFKKYEDFEPRPYGLIRIKKCYEREESVEFNL